MSEKPAPYKVTGTPFERFKDATKQILSAPKKSIPPKRPSSNRSGNR